jgi:hypothetical protein
VGKVSGGIRIRGDTLQSKVLGSHIIGEMV